VKRWWVTTYRVKEYDDIVDAIKRNKFSIKLYRPTIHIAITNNGRVSHEDRPLLFNYMFAQFDPMDVSWNVFGNIVRVRLLRRRGDPQFITGREISRIKAIVKRYNEQFDKARVDPVSLKKYVGKRVIIKDGVFNGLIGKVADSRKAGYLEVELIVFNRPIICEISVDHIELSP
jgi:transcription antitermination factor NusG